MTFASKIILFSFLVMLYDKVGDGDKVSYENFGLGRPRFHATSHSKNEAKVFFSYNANVKIVTQITSKY